MRAAWGYCRARWWLRFPITGLVYLAFPIWCFPAFLYMVALCLHEMLWEGR
jgi:hypothetical protein